MKKSLITTVETNVKLAERLIEEHINNMHHAEKSLGESGQIIWESFENINWCCEHSPVEGTIEISFSEPRNRGIRRISIPVATNFGVVCTKEKEKEYKITWSYSLS